MPLILSNYLSPPQDLIYLLTHDTVYGRYHRDVRLDEGRMIVDGQACAVLNEKNLEGLPWGAMGVDVVLECTGVFTREEHLRRHIEAGAKHVILSAPTKDDGVPTTVHGVNTARGRQIISCASCTTNAITPVMEILARRIGIRKATMTTVHAYTATQALVDRPDRDRRRGRAAAANLVPATTGAAGATAKALPDFRGIFDGVAIRVPVPVGSIADIVCLVARPTGIEEVNGIFREEAASDRYREIVGVSEEELVSSDIIGDSRAAIIDLTLTQVVDGDLVKIFSWYDNEWGYAAQLVREALAIARSMGD
jgi:glyceraldehyde 3-phosphate dehydrogenase